MFYLVFNSLQERTEFISFLKNRDISAVFHYQSLHKSEFYQKFGSEEFFCPNSDRYSDCLVRLPLHGRLSKSSVQFVIDAAAAFFGISQQEQNKFVLNEQHFADDQNVLKLGNM